MSKVTSFLQDKFNLRRRRSRQAPDEAGNEGLVELARGQKSMIPLYLVYVIAFLLGRVQIIGTLSPFGPGFYVGRTVRWVFHTSAVAVLAGTASLKQWELLIPAGISMAGNTLLVRDEDKAGYGRVANASIAGFCVFMARAITGIATGLNLSLYLSAFMEALCTIVSGLIFISAFDRASGTEKPGWRSGRVGQALMLMGLFAVGGLQGVKLFNLDIGVIVIMAATFALAYACGPSVGALTGILGGLVACMTGLESPEIIGQLGVIGVLSGLGGKLGKLEATLGYLSAGLTMAFFSDSASLIRHMLMEQTCVGCGFAHHPGCQGCLLECFRTCPASADFIGGLAQTGYQKW